MTKLYDYTSLSVLLQCEQEWDFRHRQGLARPAPEVSAHFGTVVHAGVRALFDSQPTEAVADAVGVAWGAFVAPEKKAHLNLSYAQGVVEMYGETYGLSYGLQETIDIESGVARNQQRESRIQNENGLAGTGQPAESVSGLEKPVLLGARARSAPEQDSVLDRPASPFSLVLNERYLEWPERSLCGIVDRVVRSKQDGQLYVMDLKTTGLYLSGAWFEQWRHSLQAAIYLDLVEHELNSWDEYNEQTPVSVAGFWVDAIRLDRRGYPKRDDFMRVGPFPYSAALRKELRDLTDRKVKRAQQLHMGSVPEKDPRACFRFNALCPYFTLCTLDPSDRADAVQLALASGDYEVRRWEPKERA